MSPRMRRFVPWMVVLLLALPACNEDLDDEDVSDTIPSVVFIDPTSEESDVTDLIVEEDPATPEIEFRAGHRVDTVQVTITGDPRNPEGVTFPNDIILTSYTIEWTALDGIADALVPPDWFAGISVEILANGTVTFGIEIVRHQDKSTGGVLNDLDCTIAVGAACGSIRRALATITFSGADIGGQPVTVVGFHTVVFADFGDAVGDTFGLF